MKRVFNYKKGQFWDGDEDIIYAIFDILCGDTDTVQKDTKITIISETKKIPKYKISKSYIKRGSK